MSEKIILLLLRFRIPFHIAMLSKHHRNGEKEKDKLISLHTLKQPGLPQDFI